MNNKIIEIHPNDIKSQADIKKSENVIIMGSTGSGKSFLLKNLLKEENDLNVLYIDYQFLYKNRKNFHFFNLKKLRKINEDHIKDFYDLIFKENINLIVFDEFNFFDNDFKTFISYFFYNIRKYNIQLFFSIAVPHNSEAQDIYEINNQYTKDLKSILPFFDKQFLLKNDY